MKITLIIDGQEAEIEIDDRLLGLYDMLGDTKKAEFIANELTCVIEDMLQELEDGRS